jgi:hypothetical protein
LKMKKYFLAFAATLCMSSAMTAQDSLANRAYCGTTTEEQMQLLPDLIRHKELVARGGLLQTRGAVLYVPIIFHLVAKADGTGRAFESKCLDLLCQLNNYYRDNEIQFYLRPAEGGNPPGFNYINDDALYDSPRGFLGIAASNAAKKSDAMNIYINNNANPTGQTAGVVLAYYSPQYDWIVCIRTQTGTGGGVTISHEVGHFFKLPHTHLGWDDAPYSGTACAPAYPTGSTVPTEKVARTGASANCGNAGDYFCDTPADYNGLNYRGTCPNYNGTWKDPDCVLLAPDQRNIMSYFYSCTSGFALSTEQKAVVRADLATSGTRAYLRRGVTPNTAEIAGVPTLTSPVGGVTTPYYNYIQFDWTAVPNATGYIVELAPSVTFDFNVISFYSPFNTASIDNVRLRQGVPQLVANRTYHWRVRPFSNGQACTSTSANGQFRTSGTVSNDEISAVNQFNLQPNPLSKGQNLRITLDLTENLDATLRLLDVAGRVIETQKRSFAQGNNEVNWQLDHLAAGVYFISLQTAQGNMVKKLVVAK